MLEVGWTEILVIAIVLIIVVGPKDLPQMLRTFGRTVTKLRAMAGDFRQQFDEALREADLDDVRKTIGDAQKLNPMNAIREAVNPLRQMGDEIKSDLQKATGTKTSVTEAEAVMAMEAAAGASTAAAAPKDAASIAEPVAAAPTSPVTAKPIEPIASPKPEAPVEPLKKSGTKVAAAKPAAEKSRPAKAESAKPAASKSASKPSATKSKSIEKPAATPAKKTTRKPKKDQE